jgi:hypothetical protein
MSVNIRYPNITGLSEKEQLVQIKSYLIQLVEQLNYALTTLGSGDGASQSTSAQSDSLSYVELRDFVVQELQAIESSFGKLSTKMQAEYVRDEEMMALIGELEELLTTNKDNLVEAINELAQKPSGGLRITDDGNGNVTIASTGSVTITDDGNGNVTIA